jgi:cytochrome c556
MPHIELKQRTAMRLLVLFILGAILGGAVAMLAVNALQQRSAYPRGVMAVLQNDLGRLRDIAKAPSCDATKSAELLQRLRNATQEIEPAMYPDSEVDTTFHRYAEKLRSTLDHSMTAPVLDCPTLSKTIDAISEHCDNCHREFR